jgi:RsiW-degrading membrane proteinase PrsW (M82 family)
MEITVKSSPLPRVISLVLLTLVLTWLLHRFDAHALRRIDAMAPVDFANYQRNMHSHSFLFAFVCVLLTGAIFLGLIELLALAVKALMPKTKS